MQPLTWMRATHIYHSPIFVHSNAPKQTSSSRPCAERFSLSCDNKPVSTPACHDSTVAPLLCRLLPFPSYYSFSTYTVGFAPKAVCPRQPSTRPLSHQEAAGSSVLFMLLFPLFPRPIVFSCLILSLLSLPFKLFAILPSSS